MFKRLLTRAKPTVFPAQPVSDFALEGLEDRRLLSVSPMMFGMMSGRGGFGPGPGPGIGCAFGGTTIEFSQAPTAVQTGLNALAAARNLTAPAADQTVYLGNSNGIESYAIKITADGTTSRLTVDQKGNPVTAPTLTTTTLDKITNTAVTGEINTIATALNLTAPTATTAVKVSTASDGTATYTLTLTSSSTSAKRRMTGVTISVDSNGNPVGNQRLPLSTLSTAIQTGLTSNAPAGATPLALTYLVDIRTENGVTFYSATYTTTGVRTTVTVNAAGALTNLPSVTKVQFSTIPQAAQDELQALATAAGITDPISATQDVMAYDEANGTTVYSVKLTVTTTDSKGNTRTRPIVLSVDQSGNPTVPPTGGAFAGDRPIGFGGHSRGHGGPCGLGNQDSGTTDSGTTTTTTTKTTAKKTTAAIKTTAQRKHH